MSSFLALCTGRAPTPNRRLAWTPSHQAAQMCTRDRYRQRSNRW
eukprot:COSAG06_NODE_28396_length_575_cov_0.813025_1_plen_43_part_01